MSKEDDPKDARPEPDSGKSISSRNVKSSSKKGAYIGKIFELFNAATAVIAGSLAVIMIFYNFQSSNIKEYAAYESNVRSQSAYDRLKVELDQERIHSGQLEKELKAMRNGAGPAALGIEERLSRLEVEQKKIGSIIIEDPNRALEVPFLRRELSEFEARQERSVEELRREQDRIWDLNKWLFGGLAVTVLGVALSNALRPRAFPGSAAPPDGNEKG